MMFWNSDQIICLSTIICLIVYWQLLFIQWPIHVIRKITGLNCRLWYPWYRWTSAMSLIIIAYSIIKQTTMIMKCVTEDYWYHRHQKRCWMPFIFWSPLSIPIKMLFRCYSKADFLTSRLDYLLPKRFTSFP